ncbi:hypothetical protein F4821DRAFT_277364 [Hypoxylon rubiginosum]|uniref:Uncharacterized protein n=1 Tax=Hypoxylon rubiginosum TaxID=110542 RepID=A0ACC0D5V4_9PEZI|nr:hypothetical protein F4821DRAFT_277364 [Hypoxylon rubiginosum]
MATQTVFRWTKRGSYDGLQEFKEPIPSAGSYELLVKVRSVSLNYRDVAIANMTYPYPIKDDVVPCCDMAGEVAQVGDHVEGFSVGDAVVLATSTAALYGPVKGLLHSLGGPVDGTLREYMVVPAHTAIKLPKSSHSFDQWAALVGTGSTMWNTFYAYAPLKPGQSVLLQGTGGVSLTALIFAKAAGATTIITSSSDDKLEYVKANLGVDYTINYKTHPDWAAEVQRITNGEGVDHVIENGGAGTIKQSIASVAYGGVVSVIGFLAANVPQDKMPDVAMEALNKGCVVRGILAGSKQQLEEATRHSASTGTRSSRV